MSPQRLTPVTGPVVCLMGPTAAGKTDTAVALVQQLGLEIVSVDSALIYRRMNIGTAKPDEATLALAPHRLIDIIEPWQGYSVASFVEDCLRQIADIQAKGNVPLLVGGTLMYFNALLKGLSALPEADSAVRAQIQQQIEQQGIEAVQAQLAQIDPVCAERIARGDTQRVTRALEVWRLTGQPLSVLQRENPPEPYLTQALSLVLAPASRAVLHQRIAQRFDQMLAQGFIEEVAALRAEPQASAEATSMRSVGYRQVWQYLDGAFDRAALCEKGVVATRQLAKRQLTWLRRFEQAHWYEPSDQSTLQLCHQVAQWLEKSAP